MRRLVIIGVILLVLAGCGVDGIRPTPAATLNHEINTATATTIATVIAALVTPTPTPQPPTITPTPSQTPTLTPSSTPSPTPTNSPTPTQTATPSLTPSPTSTPSPAPTPTPSVWPTVTKLVLPQATADVLQPCRFRWPGHELLVWVNLQYGLSADYEPTDLVALEGHFSAEILRGPNLQIRQPVLQPLLNIMTAMQNAGLNPSILSAYRDYAEQELAWIWWSNKYPEKVAILSAPAGHSEHQLGTTVDFGSPENNHLFQTAFADTGEGRWLAANAHLFGFTLSYPPNSYADTGIKYEPWHFRYVGIDLAAQLYQSQTPLSRWQMMNQSPPCNP